MMPGMDGPSTLQALRGIPATQATPVVFITANVQPAEVRQCQALGALDVVRKPFVAMDLSDDLLSIWSRTRAQAKGNRQPT